MTPPSRPERIGLVGWGRMGSAMGERLLEAGYRLTAFDVSSAAREQALAVGAQLASSPKDAASGKDIVVTMLPDEHAVEAASEGPTGILVGLEREALWLEMTSSHPDTTTAVARAAAAAGADFLDAPVTGGVPKARSGELTAIVAGSEASLTRARRLLDCLAAHVHHVGAEPGMGDVVKTVNNLLSAANLAIAAEGLAIGLRYGVDAAALLEVVNSGTGKSNATSWKIPRYAMPARHDSGFSIGQYAKDLRIALAVAHREGLSLSLSAGVRDRWARLVEEGAGDCDHTEIVRITAHACGLEDLQARGNDRPG